MLLFYSYSHANEDLRRRLDIHLSGLKRSGLISAWHDRMLLPGDSLEEITQWIEKADIILFLVSPDFLESPFIQENEVKRAMERHRNGEARVIPVILETVDLRGAPFEQLVRLPTGGKAVTDWPNRENALADIAQGIRRVVETERERPQRRRPDHTGYDHRASIPLPWTEAPILTKPRSVPRNQRREFADRKIEFGPIELNEAALILPPPRRIWEASSIGWKYAREYKLHPFWKGVVPRKKAGPKEDRQIGRHVRLAAAGLARCPSPHEVNFIWQKTSWSQSGQTNGRLSDPNASYNGRPIKCWFEERDLVLPPLESQSEVWHDPPLANRFAINLAVILRSSEGECGSAVFQNRYPSRLAFYNGIEAGVSESIHGEDGWGGHEHEIDIVNGHPDLIRTARRCLWQELGISERGSTDGSLPGFDIKIYFTGIILNKRELSPRLTGCAIVGGEASDFEFSNRETLIKRIRHEEFSLRNVGDAVQWQNIHFAEASPQGLAWILRQNARSGPRSLGPECRARLIFYLNWKFGRERASAEFAEHYDRAARPEWWPK